MRLECLRETRAHVTCIHSPKAVHCNLDGACVTGAHRDVASISSYKLGIARTYNDAIDSRRVGRRVVRRAWRREILRGAHVGVEVRISKVRNENKFDALRKCQVQIRIKHEE